MTYLTTLRRYALAVGYPHTAQSSDVALSAAARLPMSEWGEARRDLLTPQTVAVNHALHVSGCAHDLRRDAAILEAHYLAGIATLPDEGAAYHNAGRLIESARALLAAIGEAE